MNLSQNSIIYIATIFFITLVCCLYYLITGCYCKIIDKYVDSNSVDSVEFYTKNHNKNTFTIQDTIQLVSKFINQSVL
jgi:hypothetical protein